MRVVLLLCVVLAGCDTMSGLGMDMQRAGSDLSTKATESKYRNAPPPQVMAYPDDVTGYEEP